MSYNKARIYKCDICGGTRIIPMKVGFNGDRYFSTPDFWSGSFRRYGKCYCEFCSRKIRDLKRQEESE